jgi:hypothetical protein
MPLGNLAGCMLQVMLFVWLKASEQVDMHSCIEAPAGK